MAVKKKRTAKQIAATKKLVAFNKARRKKNPVKKKRVTKTTKQGVKRTTKQQTRYKKRVAKKKIKGYYPNPTSVFYAFKSGSKYYDGSWFGPLSTAVMVKSKSHAVKLAHKIANAAKRPIGVHEIKK